MAKKEIYEKSKKFYPYRYSKNLLPNFIKAYLKILDKKINSGKEARIPGKFGKKYYNLLIDKYSILPKKGKDPLSVSKKIVSDFFQGLVRWRSPYLQHNVGAPVHTVSSSIYALALDENIYSIDEGLAGNSLASEMAISRILSNLAGLSSPGIGFFTFGGTGTNLYAIKMGLKKAIPNSGKDGLPDNIKIITTKNAHFSHALSADWLGVGTKNVVFLKENKDRTTSLEDMRNTMDSLLKEQKIIPTIFLNGGTTYLQTIDNIIDFVKIRDEMVKKHSLQYTPHIHIDSVIGWSWLFFRDYDFKKNPLKISKEALKLIKIQRERIKSIKYADSWGVDFHKGVGSCPVPCSVIMFNNVQDINSLSKTGDSLLETHQLASEISYFSPADFTLETSRQGGASLAAIASLHSIGIEGYQNQLANLIECKVFMRDLLDKEDSISVIKEGSSGFSLLIRLYPPEMERNPLCGNEFRSNDPDILDFVKVTNKYIREFYEWDYNNRILKNKGPSYSFSSGFEKIDGVKVSTIKIYPTSPHFNLKYAKETVDILIKQKRVFDKIRRDKQ